MNDHMPIELVYQDTANIDAADLSSGEKDLKEYLGLMNKVVESGLYDEPESSINLSSDETFKKSLLTKIKEERNSGLKYVVVVGIGGSNLGTMALYRALRGRLDVFLHAGDPKMIFVDTVSPPLTNQVIDFIENQVEEPEEILVNMISKSGETTETITNFEIVYNALKKKFGDRANDRLVFTTDRGSKLWNIAEEKKLKLLEIPQKVGGRYSVLSASGLFPLGLANFNIEGFWDGASEMVKRCLNYETYENPALVSAIISASHYQKGIIIDNNFFFNPELKSVGKWYAQLMSESIGRERNLRGEKVNIGITPVVSIGSTDLHSMAQLYLGGRRDKLTQFIYASQKDNAPRVPEELFMPGLVEDIEGKSVSDIMDAIYHGIKIAYIKNGLPFSEIVMHKISESTLGQYMQLKMMETMYLARLLGVNAFDQPKVEDYKRETREILKKL
ncbi:MAG: hypothetical protein HYT62_03835 [Candidatus Yanofskybacteria bacterium]|nr:hypothetical protein [Candidatus Yanofskybacteria bacterium]